MYVSVMKYGSTLRQWTRVSEIHHAVSISGKPDGPYVFQDVAIPVLSHNPRVVELQDGKLAMFHIFNGVPEDDHIEEEQVGRRGLQKSNRQSGGGGRLAVASEEGNDGGGSTIHVADSPYGPWTPLLHNNNTLGKCNNPAPFVVFASCEKSHVIYIVCRGGDNDGVGGTLKRADNILGPWVVVSQINPLNDPPTTTRSSQYSNPSYSRKQLQQKQYPNFNLEDPTLWIDSRGFHILYHAYVYEKDPSTRGKDCLHTVVSAYVYSQNGHDWYYGNDYPFDNSVAVDATLSTKDLVTSSDDIEQDANQTTTSTSTAATTTTTTSSSSSSSDIRTYIFATRERPSFIFENNSGHLVYCNKNLSSPRSTISQDSTNDIESSHDGADGGESTTSLSISSMRMTHLVSGVCGAPSCPEGPHGGCVNCKYDHWDFTLIQPLRVT
jgi:hypothetical protein